MLDLNALPTKWAAHRYQRSTVPTLIAVHSAETQELAQSAENTASYLAGGSTVVSVHYVVDADSIVRTARHSERTNGAGGGWNECAIHIEQAGRAAQSAAEWLDPYSRATVKRCAQVIAAVHRELPQIPVGRRLGVGEIVAAVRAGRNPCGVAAHVDLTEAAKILGRSTAGHWDPGPGYPWPVLFADVAAELGGNPNPAPHPTPNPQEADMPELVQVKGDPTVYAVGSDLEVRALTHPAQRDIVLRLWPSAAITVVSAGELAALKALSARPTV